MVKEVNGHRIPEFWTTTGDDVRIADLIAYEEADFLLWAKNTVYNKPVPSRRERGSVKIIGRKKKYFCAREPYTGTRIAVEVESPDFFNHVSKFFEITGWEAV